MIANDIFDIGNNIQCHKIEFTICPPLWIDTDYLNSTIGEMKFKEIKFLNNEGTDVTDQMKKLPTNGGLYFFIIKAETIPSIANYLVYIGRAQKTTNHNLRVRCNRYFTKYNNMKERPKIARMINYYGKHLYIKYLDLGNDNELINTLEEKLINNFLPPFNDLIPSKNIRDAVKAFS